jgi:chemotaxis protein CheD
MTLSDDEETDDGTLFEDEEDDDDADGVTFYGSDDEVESQFDDEDEEDDDDADGVTFYGSDDEVESEFGDNGDGDDGSDGDDGVTFYGSDDEVESEFDDNGDDGGMAFYGSDDEVESQFDDGDDDVTFYGDDDHVEAEMDDDDDGLTFYGSDDEVESMDAASEQAATIESKRTLSDCVKVGLADYAVADDHQCLSTSGLGSCIGVALHDRDAGVYGLVHFMLPYADDVNGNDFDDAKFADTGIESLLSEMRRKGAETNNVEAKMAGGSTMVDFSDPEDGVGRRNIDAVEAVLDEFGIEITGSDLGGERGRTIRYDPVAAELEVQIAHEDTITV